MCAIGSGSLDRLTRFTLESDETLRTFALESSAVIFTRSIVETR